MRPQLSRHSLLPDLDRSNAVLVGYHTHRHRSLKESTVRLAEALTSVVVGPPFRASRTQVLINPMDPSDVIDAVARAADEASDVLLFQYSGCGDEHNQFVPEGMDVVAELLSHSKAVRPVVILECEEGSAAWSCFTRDDLPWYEGRHSASPTMLAPANGSGSAPSDGSFIEVLARTLDAGIRGGPEVPELADVRYAIGLDYLGSALAAATESYGPAPGEVALHRRRRAPKLALSTNPSAFPPYRSEALTSDVDEVYRRWWG